MKTIQTRNARGEYVPTMREFLEELRPRAIPPEATFHVYFGRPCLTFGIRYSYAEDWSREPVREINSFLPITLGTEISEREFVSLVRAMHLTW